MSCSIAILKKQRCRKLISSHNHLFVSTGLVFETNNGSSKHIKYKVRMGKDSVPRTYEIKAQWVQFLFLEYIGDHKKLTETTAFIDDRFSKGCAFQSLFALIAHLRFIFSQPTAFLWMHYLLYMILNRVWFQPQHQCCFKAWISFFAANIL